MIMLEQQLDRQQICLKKEIMFVLHCRKLNMEYITNLHIQAQ